MVSLFPLFNEWSFIDPLPYTLNPKPYTLNPKPYRPLTVSFQINESYNRFGKPLLRTLPELWEPTRQDFNPSCS